jgi:uncharacterized protein YaiL (DUF2058 family)
MTLRDQLLKAGLVSQEKAKKVDSQSRKQTHQLKKNKTLAATEAARQAQEQRRLDAELEHKRQRDRQLNLEREEQKRRKETAARARQLIDSNRLNDSSADIRYNFLVDERYIRSVWVTHQQQKQLARGSLGIVRNEDDVYDFPLVPRETALKLGQLCPDRVLLLHLENQDLDINEEAEKF